MKWIKIVTLIGVIIANKVRSKIQNLEKYYPNLTENDKETSKLFLLHYALGNVY